MYLFFYSVFLHHFREIWYTFCTKLRSICTKSGGCCTKSGGVCTKYEETVPNPKKLKSHSTKGYSDSKVGFGTLVHFFFTGQHKARKLFLKSLLYNYYFILRCEWYNLKKCQIVPNFTLKFFEALI